MDHLEIWWITWRYGGSLGDVLDHLEMWWVTVLKDVVDHLEMWCKTIIVLHSFKENPKSLNNMHLLK